MKNLFLLLLVLFSIQSINAQIESKKITYPNGEIYIGEIKNDLPNGQGTYIFPNGETYIGEIKNGIFNGKGTYIYIDSLKYIGEFKDGIFVK